MNAFSYRLLSLDGDPHALVRMLNEMGSAGWEAVTQISCADVEEDDLADRGSPQVPAPEANRRTGTRFTSRHLKRCRRDSTAEPTPVAAAVCKHGAGSAYTRHRHDRITVRVCLTGGVCCVSTGWHSGLRRGCRCPCTRQNTLNTWRRQRWGRRFARCPRYKRSAGQRPFLRRRRAGL